MDYEKIAYGLFIALCLFLVFVIYTIYNLATNNPVANNFVKNNLVKNIPESFHPASFEPVENTEFNKKPTIENPEGYIEMMNNLGDSMPINKLSENLTGDKVSVINRESTVEQLCRSFWDADIDGPQMEGMTAPVDEFEKAAMALQNSKASDLYVDYKSQSADQLSEANI